MYGKAKIIQQLPLIPPFPLPSIAPRYARGPSHTFFPPLATFDPPYPVAPDGLLPNSVLLSKMRKSAADQQLALNWVPPSISRRQRDLMAEMEEVCSQPTLI